MSQMPNIALDLLPHSIRVCIYTPSGGVSCEIDAEGARHLARALEHAAEEIGVKLEVVCTDPQ